MSSRAMSAAISGLNVNQNELDVIGNNIANQGTVGFKSQEINFEDAISQNIKEATGANGTYGGTNASQIGLGSNVASITVDTSTGNLVSTGRPLDMAIDGEGYFMVASGDDMSDETKCVQVDPTNHVVTSVPTGTSIVYTRDGTFSTDTNGDLVTSDGYKVLGYSMMGRNLLGQSKDASGKITNYYGNVVSLSHTQDSGTLSQDSTDGTAYVSGAGGNSLSKSVNSVITAKAAGDATSTIASGDVAFVDATDPDLRTDNSDLHTLKIPKTMKEITTTDGTNYTVKDVTVTGFTVEQDGIIKATLSDKNTAAIGQIALASFANPAGLDKIGGNKYQTSANSGTATVRSGYAKEINGNDTYNQSIALINNDTNKAYGDIDQDYLEGSNVDLAQQFTNMIVASRAYQANGKTITTSDEISQTLINLKQ